MKLFKTIIAAATLIISTNIGHADIKRTLLQPTRIIWLSDTTGTSIKNPEQLLFPFSGQVSVADKAMTTMRSSARHQAAILLDFGREIQGGIRISSGMRASQQTAHLRIRFGESVSEAMSDVRPDYNKHNATNEHSLRDFTQEVPWLGSVETGNSGFRFVRIDLLDADIDYLLRGVQAISYMIDEPEIGHFNCSDPRLNQIWRTGAYTVKLNMQDYLWDGIKRDRLVWLGDLHPEVMTVNNIWGAHDVVKRTLDFAKTDTPLPGWMNGFSSYSMWWLLIHRDYYLHHGDLNYLKENQEYIRKLVMQLDECVSQSGEEKMTGVRFLDWPTSEQKDVIHDGLQSLTLITMKAALQISKWLNDSAMEEIANNCISRMENFKSQHTTASQAVSLMLLAGLSNDAERDCNTLIANGVESFSPFYGYYAVEALAQNGHIDDAINMISDYWGGMIDLGATTFWEDFNYSNSKNASRIDEMPTPERYDIHADGGAYCYVGHRLSLCHGWGAGPTPWMQRYLLGVTPLEPGCKKVQVKPHLGNIDFVEGSVPTPYGPIYIKASKTKNNKTNLTIKAPKQIKIVKSL